MAHLGFDLQSLCSCGGIGGETANDTDYYLLAPETRTRTGRDFASSRGCRARSAGDRRAIWMCSSQRFRNARGRPQCRHALRFLDGRANGRQRPFRGPSMKQLRRAARDLVSIVGVVGADPANQNGIGRLKRGVDHGAAPIALYRQLAYGRGCDEVGGAVMRNSGSEIRGPSRWLRCGAQHLSMRLRIPTVKRAGSLSVLLLAGSKSSGTATFEKSDDMHDYHLRWGIRTESGWQRRRASGIQGITAISNTRESRRLKLIHSTMTNSLRYPQSAATYRVG